jgi:hypothetical protein
MNYQMHFDPYTREHLKQRDEELLQEMEALRLQRQLRKNRQVRSWQLATWLKRDKLLVEGA